MHISDSLKRKWNYLALAFWIPFVGMLLVMIISQYKPFGKFSMLYSDMYHQYYPFFVAFRRVIRSGDSLLYNWSIGMGIDFLGLISYYLASPLNLLSVVVPEKWLLSYFSLLVPVKLGFAGLFFAFFLKKIFRRNDFSISVFGALYGVCAWALGFQWNIMWLDTFALLPLVVLGTVSLLRERKFLLYTSSLFLAVFTNYYIGFFVCIFVALLFACYEICRFPGWKRMAADLLWIAVFSLLAIGMTAILELPAFAALQTTQSSVNAFPTGFRLNIAPENTVLQMLIAMARVAGNSIGGIEPNFKEGMPNLYCGLITVILAFLYLMASEVKLRDKLCAVALLLFFNVSFIIRQLDYIWHGFHFTNMIPYRFSFLYSFVLLYMAYQAWLLRKKMDWLQILTAGFFTAAVACCCDDIRTTVPLDSWGNLPKVPVVFLYNIVFLLLYMGAMLYGSRQPKTAEDADAEELRMARRQRSIYFLQSRMLLLGIVVIEIAATLTAFGLYFPGTGISNYPKGKENGASTVRYMYEREKNDLFFRTEVTHSQTLNDGALNGYNGISAFTSSANVRVTEFMKALGYGAKNTYNRYCFEESSPVANLFLDLKYMIERDGKDRSGAIFEEIHHFGDVYLLKNSAYLPLGFLAEPELAKVDFAAKRNAFVFQNTLFSASTGMDPDVFYRIPQEELEIEGNSVQISTNSSSGVCSYSESGGDGYITWFFHISRPGFLCINLDLPKRNDFVVTLNEVDVYRENISLPQMLAVGDVKPGDVVGVRVITQPGESATATVNGAILDIPLFMEGYEKLSASTLKLTTFRNTFVEGTIDCNRDGLLYTSIPQNGNWKVLVDGEAAEIRLVGDCMISVLLERGTHRVSFIYENEAYALGWKISLGCLLVFGGLYCLVYQPDFKNRRFLKK